MGQLQAGLL